MIDIPCTVLWVPYRVVHTIRCMPQLSQDLTSSTGPELPLRHNRAKCVMNTPFFRTSVAERTFFFGSQFGDRDWFRVATVVRTKTKTQA